MVQNVQNASKLLKLFQNASKCFNYSKLPQNWFNILQKMLQNYFKNYFEFATKLLQNALTCIKIRQNTLGMSSAQKYLAKCCRIVPSAEKYVKEPQFSFMQPTKLSKHTQKVCAYGSQHNTSFKDPSKLFQICFKVASKMLQIVF